MKHAIVTGGAGFIGSHLVEKLVQQSNYSQIHVIDRLSDGGSINNLDLNNSRVSFIKEDICNMNAMRDFFSTLKKKNFDLFHLAAESHVDRSIRSGLPFVESNLVGTQCILECAIEFRVDRMLHVSTDEVYGALIENEANETHPLNPSSAYSASKAGSDLLVLAARTTHNLDVVVTRCVNNFGIRQAPEKFIPRMILRSLLGLPLPIYGSGEQVREWISVGDHTEALIKLINFGRSASVYNIGTSNRVRNIDIATQVIRETGSKSKIIHVDDRKGHDFRYAVNHQLLKDAINWIPKDDLSAHIPTLVNHYRSKLQNHDFVIDFEASEAKYIDN